MRVISLLAVLAAVAWGQAGTLAHGIELFQRGEYVAAQKSLLRVIESRDDPRARTFLALAQAATAQCDVAVRELAGFEKLEDQQLRRLAGLGLARCRIAGKQFAEAIAALYRLKELYPSDADVLFETARAQMKAWNDVVFEMFQKTPASFRVNQLSAEVFEIQGKYGGAIAEYRKALAKSPKTLNLHYRLGRALLMESHSPEALAEALGEFEAELALNPSDAVAEFQVGQILVARQKTDEALPRFERAVELDPDFPEALVALGRVRSRNQQHDEAIELLERAVGSVPESESALYALMLAYRNAGRRDDALRVKEKLDALRKTPRGEFTEFLERIGEEPAPQ